MHDRPPDDDPKRRERLDREAADKRAYRALIDDGGAVLRGMPVHDINGLTELVTELGWLKEAKSEDRKALVAAVGAMLDDLVANRSR